ncbi:MAG: hypothetical protein ACREN7_06775 [Candidatus Dormibacteria bacterium]
MVLLGLPALLVAGCGGRSTISLTCKVPLEAVPSRGSPIPIGRCDGLLGGGVAHVTLSPNQTVTISLLQREGFGNVTLSNSDPEALRPIAGDEGYTLATYAGAHPGFAKITALSLACPAGQASGHPSRCLIATVRVK